MKPAPRRKTSPKLALRIARAQLRALRSVVPISPPQTGPSQFIQCWAVNRGMSGVTQALDSTGQVWERVSLMDEKVSEETGKKVKYVRESYWEPVPMTRKEKP